MMAILREYLDRIWDFWSNFPWGQFLKTADFRRECTVKSMQEKLDKMLKGGDVKRSFLVQQMNEMQGGKQVTLAMMNRYTRKDDQRAPLPLELLPVLTAVTQDFSLVEWLLECFNLKCLNADEAKAFELFKAQQAVGEMSSQVEALKSELDK